MHRVKAGLFAALAVLVAVSALSGCGCLRRGLIRINDEKILKEDYYDRLEKLTVSTPQGSRMAGEFIMRKIIQDRLILQFAEERGVPATDAQIDRQVRITKRMEGADLTTKLRDQGMSLEDFKRELKVAQARSNIMGKGITIPEGDVKKAYQEVMNLNPSPYKRPNQILFSVIVVSTKEKADKAYQMLQAGTDFATVAMQVSEAANAKNRGGRVDWVSKDDPRVAKEIRQLVYSVPVGRYTKPRKLQSGGSTAWLIVRADRKRDELVLPYAEVKEVVRGRLKEQEGMRKNGKRVLMDFQRFVQAADIQINYPRYKELPDALKKQAGDMLQMMKKEPEKPPKEVAPGTTP